ncbi:MAG: hypothetical protein R3D02_05150 [Hyphomicrobiales bacterium]
MSERHHDQAKVMAARRPSRLRRILGALVTLSLVGGLAAAAVPLLPRALDAARLLDTGDDPVAVADYRLAKVPPADYAAALDKALAAGDADLAKSIAELAASRGVTLADGAPARIAAAKAAEKERAFGDAWQGFVSGGAGNEAALAGSLAADLSGFGDFRDLFREAGHHLAGVPVDTTTVALAAIGAGLTAATVVSVGSALPVKTGVSALKAASRAGRLSRPLARQVARLGREAVDTAALRGVGVSLARFDATAAKGAARSVLRPAPAAAIRRLAGDVGTIGRNTGYRGVTDVLARAGSAAEVSRFARVSRRFGRATRGALVLLADATLTIGALLTTLVSWLAAAALWAFAAISLLLRWTRRLARLAGRRRLAPA